MWNTTAAVFIAILQQSKYYDEANTFFWSPKRCKVFKWNLTPCYFFYFEIGHVVKFLTQNDAFWKAWKKYDFHGPKGTETWFFECNFFENPVSWKTFISKSEDLFKLQFKSWRVLFWIQNLTICTIFVSKIGRTKSLIQKLTRGEVFDPKLIFCSFSSSSIKQLEKRINRRSSQLLLHDNWWVLFILCLFFFIWGLMMAVTTSSFSLPIHVHIARWVAKLVSLQIFNFQRY